MLTYNNKILKVGNGALNYPPPRNFSVLLGRNSYPNTFYTWARRPTGSPDDWPSDFGSAIWKCNSEGLFWKKIGGSQFIRADFKRLGDENNFDASKASNVYPTFFQVTASEELGWVSRPALPFTYFDTGIMPSAIFNTSQIIDTNFETKFGTFLATEVIRFGWLAWNIDNENSEKSWVICKCPQSSYSDMYDSIMTFAEQK